MVVSDFARPFPLQFAGSGLARWILARFGWTVEFDGFPGSQGVLVVYPHTSNWDFVVMMLAKWSIGVPVQFWGKASLFDIPLFGRWLRWVGGVPVDRLSPHGVVGQMADLLSEKRAENEYFWLGLAPEGSRQANPGWRSGFYHAAVKAAVPVGLIRLDYGQHKVVVMDFIALTGNSSLDFSRIATVYDGVQGRIPQNASPIGLLDASVPRADTIVKKP
ncbi:MAG: hypothetical protein RIS34_1915 [Pseudomonadota bacterium]|jgi:1-acyl-sn-glycerol-3-phosphate acyltransferase